MGKRNTERAQSAAEIKTLTDQIAQHTTELQNKTNEATLASKQLQIKSTEHDRLRVKLSMVEPKALAAAPLLEKVVSRVVSHRVPFRLLIVSRFFLLFSRLPSRPNGTPSSPNSRSLLLLLRLFLSLLNFEPNSYVLPVSLRRLESLFSSPSLRLHLPQEKTKSERDALAAQLKAATEASTAAGVPVDQRIVSSRLLF